jgi:hypothetical protein
MAPRSLRSLCDHASDGKPKDYYLKLPRASGAVGPGCISSLHPPIRTVVGRRGEVWEVLPMPIRTACAPAVGTLIH